MFIIVYNALERTRTIMMTISNERAKSLIEGMEEIAKKKHSERIKFGIQRKREKELNQRKD